MAKFYGVIGYGNTVETVPGVWVDVITERNYYGDVIRDTRQLGEGTTLNDNILIGNSFSILADAYAYLNFSAMRYIRWAGSLWTVSDVEAKAPRLIVRVGGVYNGPTVATAVAP